MTSLTVRKRMSETDPDIEGRQISLGTALPTIPERLLLAHAKREVLFVCGAGVSVPAGLPQFRSLVLKVYEKLDRAVFPILRCGAGAGGSKLDGLTPEQAAEVRRFEMGDYDVVLGMLERRLDHSSVGESGDGVVRRAVRRILSEVDCGKAGSPPKPAPIHRAIARLADRGMGPLVVTTNFDLLLEEAAARIGRRRPTTYALAGIPRPSTRLGFTGVLHIHGALANNPNRIVELVLSEQDFGEFYMRRRVVPDFIYDAARLYHLVLIGYSANDPPMRYLLNAVAADGSRFGDIKERFSFVDVEDAGDVEDATSLADWTARGITPIPYSRANDHDQLSKVLERWSRLSAVNGKQGALDREIRRVVRMPRQDATDADQGLFDHLLRRSERRERERLMDVAKRAGAELGWLDAAARVMRERVGGGGR